jgi:hypothetical protein
MIRPSVIIYSRLIVEEHGLDLVLSAFAAFAVFSRADMTVRDALHWYVVIQQ